MRFKLIFDWFVGSITWNCAELSFNWNNKIEYLQIKGNDEDFVGLLPDATVSVDEGR